MKIAVIGAGAIGCIVAGYLRKAGEDIALIGRAAQVEAIRQNGLIIKGIHGEEKIELKILEKLDQEYDLVVFTVKTQDLEEAYQQNSVYLEHDNLWILTAQNGVQADNMISIHFDKEKVISSIVMFGATYIRPGEVIHNFEGDWIIGQPFMLNAPIVEQVAGHLSKAFNVVTTTDIIGMKWLKLFVNFNNCIPALIGKSMQETFADMDFCRLSILLLKEGFAITQEAKVELVSLPNFPAERISGLVNMPIEQAAGIMNKTLTTLSKEPLFGSVLQSVMRKRISEIDYINGEVAILAKNVRKEAPLNKRIVDLVHDVEASGQFFTPEKIKEVFALNQSSI